MEKETLKQQIDEKSKLLREALDALEQMDSERQLEKSRYEEEILELRKTISQHNSLEVQSPVNSDELKSGMETKQKEDISANSHKLLLEAFGSVNLGTHPESDDETEQQKQQNLGAPGEKPGNGQECKKYEEIIQTLECKVAKEEDNCNYLKKLNEKNTEELNECKLNQAKLDQHIDSLQCQIGLLNNEKQSLSEENNSLNKKYEEIRIEMETELEGKHNECVNMQQEFDQKQDEISSLCQKIDHLEQEVRIYKQESHLAGEKIQGLNYELVTLKARLDQERQDTDSFLEQAKNVDDLREKLASKKLQLKTLEENQEKAELCISGLTQMTIELKQSVAKLEKDVKTRDKAIDKLTTEYEKVKAKVRRYRSMREQAENQIPGQECVENSGSSLGDDHYVLSTRDKENIANLLSELDAIKKNEELLRKENQRLKSLCSKSNLDREKSNISDKENMYPTKRNILSPSSFEQDTSITNQKQNSNDRLQNKRSSILIGTENKPRNRPLDNEELHYLKEEVQLHQKEISLLKGELRVCKTVFMKTGASRAMEKVEKVYSSQMSKVDHAHGKIVGMMRKRLEELAECIQKILGSHSANLSAFNASNLSTGDVSVLSDILNESKRLSKSFYKAPRYVRTNIPKTNIIVRVADFSSGSLYLNAIISKLNIF